MAIMRPDDDFCRPSGLRRGQKVEPLTDATNSESHVLVSRVPIDICSN
jgi:hypothetical protein